LRGGVRLAIPRVFGIPRSRFTARRGSLNPRAAIRNPPEYGSRIRNCTNTKRDTGNLEIAADAQLCQPKRLALCNFATALYTLGCRFAALRALTRKAALRRPLEHAHLDQNEQTTQMGTTLAASSCT